MKTPEERKHSGRNEGSKSHEGHDPDLTLALLDFAEPIVDRVHLGTTIEQFKDALEFAVNIWNVLVLDAEIPEATVLKDLRDNLGDNNADPETLAMLDTLVARYKKKYPSDRRTMSNLVVSRPERNAFEVTVKRV